MIATSLGVVSFSALGSPSARAQRRLMRSNWHLRVSRARISIRTGADRLPEWRARVVGYYNSFFYSGSILSTGVAYAANKSPSELAFRLPLGLQLVPPLFILIGCTMIPESPRWLCARGKHDEAAAILAKYHGGGSSMFYPDLYLFVSGPMQSSYSFWLFPSMRLELASYSNISKK